MIFQPLFTGLHESLKEMRDHEDQMGRLRVVFGNSDRGKELAGYAFGEAIKTTLPNYAVVKITLKKVYEDAAAGKPIERQDIIDFVEWLSKNFRHSYETWILMPFNIQKLDFEVLEIYQQYSKK